MEAQSLKYISIDLILLLMIVYFVYQIESRAMKPCIAVLYISSVFVSLCLYFNNTHLQHKEFNCDIFLCQMWNTSFPKKNLFKTII